MAVDLCSQETGVEPWLTSRVTLGNSRHLSGLSGLHLFWLPRLKNGWGLSQGNRNHARCFKPRGYKTGNWLHRCWETGRTERGRRINPVINDCRKQLPLLGQEGTKGTCERGGGADASGAASVEETAPSRHSSGKSGAASSTHTTEEGKKERRKQKKPWHSFCFPPTFWSPTSAPYWQNPVTRSQGTPVYKLPALQEGTWQEWTWGRETINRKEAVYEFILSDVKVSSWSQLLRFSCLY